MDSDEEPDPDAAPLESNIGIEEWYVCYYVVVGIPEGKKEKDLRREIKRDYGPTLHKATFRRMFNSLRHDREVEPGGVGTWLVQVPNVVADKWDTDGGVVMWGDKRWAYPFGEVVSCGICCEVGHSEEECKWTHSWCKICEVGHKSKDCKGQVLAKCVVCARRGAPLEEMGHQPGKGEYPVYRVAIRQGWLDGN